MIFLIVINIMSLGILLYPKYYMLYRSGADYTVKLTYWAVLSN